MLSIQGTLSDSPVCWPGVHREWISNNDKGSCGLVGSTLSSESSWARISWQLGHAGGGSREE